MQFVFDKKAHLTKLAHMRFFNLINFLKKVFDTGGLHLQHLARRWQTLDRQTKDT